MSAPPGQMTALRADLIERIDLAQDEITRAHLHRKIFRDVRDAIVREHPDADATFLFSYSEVYVHSQAMLVRRMTDQHPDRPNSLWWVAERIRKNPGIADRATFVAAGADQYERDSWEHDAWTRRNNVDFTGNWGDGDSPADDRLAALQSQLVSAAQNVVAFVDKRIAHTDTSPNRDFAMTFDDVDTALDQLHEIANTLSVLLRQSSRFDDVAIQGDWKRPLRLSLWPDDQRRIDEWERHSEQRRAGRADT